MRLFQSQFKPGRIELLPLALFLVDGKASPRKGELLMKLLLAQFRTLKCLRNA